MIRSNPTAIPLRASDVKILQTQLEKRKVADQTNPPQLQNASGESDTRKGQETNHDAVDAARQERQQKTARERIGL